jgi:transglutaminase-like putative cysteine protease
MFPELELKEGWATVFGLTMMSLFVAWSIQSAHWAEGLSILQGVVLLASLLGILLAKSHVPNRLAHLLSLVTGFTWSAFLTSRVLAGSLQIPASRAVVELEGRIEYFLYILYTGQRHADNLIFVLLLSLLLWMMAYFCAWAVFRWQRVWWAAIVAGVALMVNINYASGNLTGFVIGFLLFALLLVVRTSLASYEQEWRMEGIGYSPELVYHFLRTGVFISALAIFLAWIAPGALASNPLQQVLDQVGQPWRKLQDESSRLFQDLNYQNQPARIYSDRRMTLGGAVNLTDTPIMDVEASTGRYWRAMVYHQYTGDGWTNTDSDALWIEENKQDLTVPEFDLRQEMTQTFTLKRDLGPKGTIVAAGQPLRANIPIEAAVSYITHEDDLLRSKADPLYPPTPGDPSVLYARKPLRTGDSYRVLSSLSQADEESLRQAGTDYPNWIKPRYLQLPDSLPERVRTLAQRITDGQETPYDKAKAIESYLRQIPYNAQIDGPSPGQDGVDYFLFKEKQGYCNYYASAMAVMLRSVGVPARFVQGYSQGTLEQGVYHILERDGHAWPEVFFPGYGWVEFEPTGGEPPLDRPSSRESTSGSNLGQDRESWQRYLEKQMDDEPDPSAMGATSALPQRLLWQRIEHWAAFLLVLAVVGTTATGFFSFRHRRRIEGLSAAERVYGDLVDWSRRLLRLQPLEHQTPYEFGRSVALSVPRGDQAIEQITGLFVEERFGNKVVPDAVAESAWERARVALWQRWVGRRLDRVRLTWARFFPPGEIGDGTD